MDEEDRKKLAELLENHSIETVLEVYFEDNCYGEVVTAIMNHIDSRLQKLSKVEEIFKNK
jgi:hypothetical protein